MPKSCCVVNCTNNVKNHPELKFYMLPKEEKRRRKWLNAINRAEESSASSKPWSPKSIHVYVCSAHFISGKYSIFISTNECIMHPNAKFLLNIMYSFLGKRELFEKHPDAVPSIFPSDTGTKGKSPHRSGNLNEIKRVNRRISRQGMLRLFIGTIFIPG